MKPYTDVNFFECGRESWKNNLDIDMAYLVLMAAINDLETK